MKKTVAWSLGLLSLTAIMTVLASFGLSEFRSPVQVPATGRTAPAAIEIRATGFVPDVLVIPVNSSVCWKNTDVKPHRPISATAEARSLDPGKDLRPLETWCFPFAQAGTWQYEDKINRRLKGKITVQ